MWIYLYISFLYSSHLTMGLSVNLHTCTHSHSQSRTHAHIHTTTFWLANTRAHIGEWRARHRKRKKKKEQHQSQTISLATDESVTSPFWLPLGMGMSNVLSEHTCRTTENKHMEIYRTNANNAAGDWDLNYATIQSTANFVATLGTMFALLIFWF